MSMQGMSWLACLVLAMFCSAAAPGRAAADEVIKQDEYYEILSGTADGLIAELERKKPGQAWSISRIEYTLYNHYLKSHGWCRLDFTTYSIRVARLLPRWTGKHFANQCLRDRWQDLMEELTAIEAAKDHAIRSGRDVLSYEVVRLGRYRHCSEIDARLDRVVRGIERRFGDYSTYVSKRHFDLRKLKNIFDECR